MIRRREAGAARATLSLRAISHGNVAASGKVLVAGGFNGNGWYLEQRGAV